LERNAIFQTELLSIFLTALTVVQLRISFWLVGGKADAKSLFIASAYFTVGGLFIVLVFLVLATGILKEQDPELFAKISASKALMPEPEWEERSSFMVYAWIVTAGLLSGTLIWTAIVWGAFRRLTGVSKSRAFLAFMVNLLLFVPSMVLSYFLTIALQ